MHQKIRRLLTLPLLLIALGSATIVHAQAREESRLLIASEVLDELRTQRDDVIPERLLQRAYAVANILINSGVPAGRLTAVGRGEDQPVATNLTVAGRAQNRRVEIIIHPNN